MAALNWTIALPEIVLALCAMAILMIGVFLRRNAWSTSAMLSLAALVVTAVLLSLIHI